MPNPVPLPPPGFDDLSVDEKLDYLQSLWDRIAASPESIPVPEWHREVLDERLKDLEAISPAFAISARRTPRDVASPAAQLLRLPVLGA